MQHKIKVSRTAHYHTIGEDNKEIKTIWFVLHGYGYLAKRFIKKFNPIASADNLIVAPEALSKFYLNGVGYDGKIGASWMTADDREDEKEDYINYLNQLYAEVTKDHPNAKVNVVGFSQGGATASRWIADGKMKCANAIMWSSAFPEDLDLKSLPKESNIFVLFGDNDKFINEQQIKDYEAFLEAKDFDCKLIKFVGKHDIPKHILLEQIGANGW